MKNPVLKAPYPWMGGKSKVADLVWKRLGDVDNYVEPFAGSIAVLLRRPAEHLAHGYRVETMNDLNHYVVNVWRAIAADPDAVAKYADWPVTEADLHARHAWLVRSAEVAEWRERMRADPKAFDAKIAGWWIWGACCWIGSGWCNDKDTQSVQVPRMGARFGQMDAPGVLHPTACRPQLTDAFDIGQGVNAGGNLSVQVPCLRDFALGRGVNSQPSAGTCEVRRAWLTDWMRRLSDRMRLVRTCYGHWSRVCDSDSTLTRLGTTGVFLDPPYPVKSTNGKASRADELYSTDKGSDLDALRDEVLDWCRKWGRDPMIRVAVCGYEGDGYEALEQEGWTVESWEAGGGYANQSKGAGKAANAKRERIWFSASCIANQQRSIFDLHETTLTTGVPA